jgi:hypothetical protein
MDVLRTLTKNANIKDVSKEAEETQALSDAAFAAKVSIEARMLAERDRNTGKKRGWSWQTRVEYEQTAQHPYANYTGYLRSETSGFWPKKETKKIQNLYHCMSKVDQKL